MNITFANKIQSVNSGFNFSSTIIDSLSRQLYASTESFVELMEGPLSKNKSNLKYFESSLFATVLEDAMCSLQILEECNNTIRVMKTNLDMMPLLARKFAVPQRTGRNELDDVDPSRLGCLEYKLQKLENDRKYLKDVFVGIYTDLSLKRCFLHLSEQVKVTVDRADHREFLVGEEAQNRIFRRDLNRQLRHQRNHIKSVYYDTDSIIANLKTNVEDAGLNTSIRSRYVDNWQTARTEQNQQTIQDREAKPLKTIFHFKQKTDQEHRIHTEIELLMNICINENLQKVEDWMTKYDKDIEALDLKIQKKRNQLEDMKNQTQTLEETIEEHARLSRNWVNFKDERERARLYREKMNNAAISIQAWWRGLLVRNQLGPYKVVKKPPPPAGKKKK